MKRKKFQVLAPTAQQGPGDAHAMNRGAQIGLPDSPFLTLEEGARYCRFDTCVNPVRALSKWLERQAVPGGPARADDPGRARRVGVRAARKVRPRSPVAPSLNESATSLSETDPRSPIPRR